MSKNVFRPHGADIFKTLVSSTFGSQLTLEKLNTTITQIVKTQKGNNMTNKNNQQDKTRKSGMLLK